MPSRSNSAVILSETSKKEKDKVKSHKKEKPNAENASVYVLGIPEPTRRAELMKHWMNLSLDDKTANKMLWISDNGSKVSRRTEEVCPVLDRPERYEYSPQVVCKEGLWNMRAYWEVEYSGWVVIGATYEGAGRRAHSGPSGLGENEESWGMCWSGSCYQIWFNGVNKDIDNVPYCTTIGVYIDQPAGIINFYTVTGEGSEREVRLLHNIKATIEKKVLPGFWVGIQSSCTLLRKTE
ncbi:tripartite motif-containing 16 [Solea senegalensis]|uniref:Tripartite motif-containing 16 n=1 Tax=Solea senegalensis TaxID=28829 RepID=A0AAV6RPI6_SOLSE|nr:stonustoxin subunit beta-like [Solea senegalensis]KAG7507408.1 tripartite motif-containing 16 [Solea senegalensis]